LTGVVNEIAAEEVTPELVPRAFVAVREFVERAAVLWIKKHQRCAAIRQVSQQHERVATLSRIPPKS
jgi:hypothetical protein